MLDKIANEAGGATALVPACNCGKRVADILFCNAEIQPVKYCLG